MTDIQNLLMCLAEIQTDESGDSYFICGEIPKELINRLKEDNGLV